MKSPRVLLVLVATLVATSAPAGDGKKDEDLLQGTWTVVRLERSGRAEQGDLSFITVKITGNELVLMEMEEKDPPRQFKLDASKNPKQIDFLGKGKEIAPGIYKLDKDKLTLCYNRNGEPRPTKFSTSADDSHVVMVLERKKK
jgi:uncharacterized protein (TIGR03067 family)